MFTVISQQIVWALNWITIEQFPRSTARTTSSRRGSNLIWPWLMPSGSHKVWCERWRAVLQFTYQSAVDLGWSHAPSCPSTERWSTKNKRVVCHPLTNLTPLLQPSQRPVYKLRHYNMLTKTSIAACNNLLFAKPNHWTETVKSKLNKGNSMAGLSSFGVFPHTGVVSKTQHTNKLEAGVSF